MLAAPPPLRAQQSGFLEGGQMLGQRLSRQAGAMPGDHSYMKLEQRLAVAFRQFVHEAAACRIGKRPEQQVEVHGAVIPDAKASCNEKVA